jgi:hypothetical protein
MRWGGRLVYVALLVVMAVVFTLVGKKLAEAPGVRKSPRGLRATGPDVPYGSDTGYDDAGGSAVDRSGDVSPETSGETQPTEPPPGIAQAKGRGTRPAGASTEQARRESSSTRPRRTLRPRGHREPSYQTRIALGKAPKRDVEVWIAKDVVEHPDRTVLDLNGSDITNAGLSLLSRQSDLEGLHLRRTKISDAGILELANLPRLKELMLGGTGLTDEGLNALEWLTEMEVLYLWDTKITDEGLFYLRRMTRLRRLFLGKTGITGRGLRHLQCVPTLEILYLDETKVDDNSLRHVARFTGLKKLSIFKTRITDAGLLHLRGLEKLEELLLRYAPVTDEGIADLKKALPLLWRDGGPIR